MICFEYFKKKKSHFHLIRFKDYVKFIKTRVLNFFLSFFVFVFLKGFEIEIKKKKLISVELVKQSTGINKN